MINILPKTSLIALTLVSLAGCVEREANIDSTFRYSQDGVSFEYPSNWSVTEDSIVDGARYIFIETPGDALTKVEIYDPDQSFTLEEFAELDIDILMENLPTGFSVKPSREFLPFEKILENRTLNGIQTDFTISIVGVEVPHTNQFFMFSSTSAVAYVATQVADEDSDKVAKGFDVITGSFVIE